MIPRLEPAPEQAFPGMFGPDDAEMPLHCYNLYGLFEHCRGGDYRLR
jgi:hypothetical protein